MIAPNDGGDAGTLRTSTWPLALINQDGFSFQPSRLAQASYVSLSLSLSAARVFIV